MEEGEGRQEREQGYRRGWAERDERLGTKGHTVQHSERKLARREKGKMERAQARREECRGRERKSECEKWRREWGGRGERLKEIEGGGKGNGREKEKQDRREKIKRPGCEKEASISPVNTGAPLDPDPRSPSACCHSPIVCLGSLDSRCPPSPLTLILFSCSFPQISLSPEVV